MASDRHTEAARALLGLDTNLRDDMTEPRVHRVATALANAEREGMRRAAEIARHLNGWGADCGRGGHAEHIAKVISEAGEGAQ